MNPYLLLAIGIMWVFTVGGAYLKGQEDQSNAMLAASYQDGVKSIRKFNEYRAEDLEAVRLAGERRARADLKARQIQYEFEMEAMHGTLLTYKNPSVPGQPPQDMGPVVVSAAGMRLLNDAIAEYNANAVTPDSSPSAVPPDGKPADRPGGRGTQTTAGLNLKPSSYLRQDAR